MVDESRRDFLKKAGYTALGLGCGLPLLGAAGSVLRERNGGKALSSSQLAMVIDVRKCMNEELRRACTGACRREHNLPDSPRPEREAKWIWSDKFEKAFPGQAHGHVASELKGKPVLVLCNHCTQPACVKVCPTGATWKRKSDGVVMMDMHRCIGCRYCVAACPYGARSFNWSDSRQGLKEDKIRPEFPTRSKGVAEKCTFCAERIRADRKPACVEAAEKVRKGAMTFGNTSDPDSEVSRLLREKHTICRSLGLGTGPNVFYIV